MSRWILKTVLVFLFGCGPVLPIENPFPPRGLSQEADSPEFSPLRITILDVGQGDSTLVTGPSGDSLLIDAGRAEAGVIVTEAVASHLEGDLGDSQGDLKILLSHFDADHIGGLSIFLASLKEPPKILDRGLATDKDTTVFSDYLETAESFRREANPGMEIDLGNGALARVIVVNGHYSDGRVIHLNPDEENEASIGLLIEYGGFEYFTAGDLTGGGAPGGYETKDMETFAGEIVGDIDILHVGHHGSSSSTNEGFLNLVKPEAAVISVGKENDYGHPTETVLTRLKKAGAQVYRTDEMGTIEIETDGTGFDISPLN